MAQCGNCQFHNMPGATHCGRCSASLLLATSVIDVHPPRAGKWAKALRKTRVPRLVRSLSSQAISVAGRIGFEPEARLPQLGVLLRMIVPGWPQIYSGHPLLGVCLLAAYTFCCLVAALFIGTTFSSLTIAALVTIHAISIYEIGYRSTKSQGGRLSRFLLGSGLLGFFIYIPGYSLLASVAAPIEIRVDRPPLQRGEVLVVNRSAFRSTAPRVGDIVVYDLPEVRVAGAAPGGGNAIYLVRGDRIDRILAGPNQTVHWEHETLTVDGVPSKWMPLNPQGMPRKIESTVPAGHYLIFFSTEGFNWGFINDETQLQPLFMIPASRIGGRVYWRSWPLNRMGPL